MSNLSTMVTLPFELSLSGCSFGVFLVAVRSFTIPFAATVGCLVSHLSTLIALAFILFSSSKEATFSSEINGILLIVVAKHFHQETS